MDSEASYGPRLGRSLAEHGDRSNIDALFLVKVESLVCTVKMIGPSHFAGAGRCAPARLALCRYIILNIIQVLLLLHSYHQLPK